MSRSLAEQPMAAARESESESLASRYRRLTSRRVAILVALGLAILLSLGLDITSGPADLSLGEVVGGLFDADSLALRDRIILWNVRLPDALIALAVGGALGLAGVEAQTVLNNPLASPFTLGVSAAATLGAALAIVYGAAIPLPEALPKTALLPAPALVLALAAGGLVLMFARLFNAERDVIVLFGVGLFFLCQALIALLQLIADAEAAQRIVLWQVGDLTRAGWFELAVVSAALAIAAPLSLRQVWRLTLLRSGEAQARALGVDIERLRTTTILRMSVLTAIAVCFVGAISFVGLVGPHIARLLLGEDHRFLMPGAALCGMLTLSIASALSKALIPGVLIPVGILTAIIGAPVLIALLVARRGSGA